MSEINMTPLVDVMLVLLIIFILAVPVLTRMLPVDLPETDGAEQAAEPDANQLGIATDGALMWNEQPLRDDELATLATQKPQPELQIQADKQVPFEKVAQVLATAQAAKLEKLSFLTEPPLEQAGSVLLQKNSV
ncbi:ExbD/TolR family protein [Permianibacter aggregans]|nr:biopolymer transporter ExbD [Permianibacter aggregans]